MKYLTGNIGQVKPLKYVSDQPVLEFTVAENFRLARDEVTYWYDVEVWGVRGERLAPYVRKGEPITVMGQNSDRIWDGRIFRRIKAVEVILIKGAKNRQEHEEEAEAAPPEIEDDPFA